MCQKVTRPTNCAILLERRLQLPVLAKRAVCSGTRQTNIIRHKTNSSTRPLGSALNGSISQAVGCGSTFITVIKAQPEGCALRSVWTQRPQQACRVSALSSNEQPLGLTAVILSRDIKMLRTSDFVEQVAKCRALPHIICSAAIGVYNDRPRHTSRHGDAHAAGPWHVCLTQTRLGWAEPPRRHYSLVFQT